MEECGIAVPDYLNLADEGKTPLYFADETGKYLGVIAAADVLKSDSEIAIKKLQEMQLDVIMLTGDNGKTAKAIAGKAGIRHVISDVMPTDKAAVIEKLRGEGHRVLMVGDGINDAPALALADVGMAISSGTDIAMESADIVLMNSSLSAVSSAIALSKATIKNIRQNLFWAFFYNTLGIPVAAGLLFLPLGLKLSPMLGAAAMSMFTIEGAEFLENTIAGVQGLNGRTSGVVASPVAGSKLVMSGYSGIGVFAPHRSFILMQN